MIRYYKRRGIPVSGAMPPQEEVLQHRDMAWLLPEAASATVTQGCAH
jgi:hypothetical protein